MVETFPWLGLPVVAAFAAALVLTPRPLFAEAGEAPPPRRLEITLIAVLAVAGAAILASGLGGPAWTSILLAVALMAFAAVVYSDLRYLIIPDVYSLALGALALIGPLAPGLAIAIPGALLCGGLLAGVAYIFRRSADVEGMGLGDVKLAAAVGGLLGMEHGVWAIALSAIVAGVIGLVLRLRAAKDARGEVMLLPYGAALALAGAGFLIWAHA